MKSITLLLPIFLLVSPALAGDFELKDGDRVVWLGSTVIEREQHYGYWEAALTTRWPDRKITFRNLGWSGDDVFGTARLAFDINKPELGLKRMVDLTLAEKPTVIFICYGTNESFEGEAGLEKFAKGYEKLLEGLAPAKARIYLMTPFRPAKSLPEAINSTYLNDGLKLYCEQIQKIAKNKGLTCVDLFNTPPIDDSLFDAGMHLNEKGYKKSVDNLFRALGQVSKVLTPEPLRQAIIEKNKLYFYRWRPQNETYLFGFRKHEQGRNAKEIVEFDPLIAKAEEEIDRIKNRPAKKTEEGK